MRLGRKWLFSSDLMLHLLGIKYLWRCSQIVFKKSCLYPCPTSEPSTYKVAIARNLKHFGLRMKADELHGVRNSKTYDCIKVTNSTLSETHKLRQTASGLAVSTWTVTESHSSRDLKPIATRYRDHLVTTWTKLWLARHCHSSSLRNKNLAPWMPLRCCRQPNVSNKDNGLWHWLLQPARASGKRLHWLPICG